MRDLASTLIHNLKTPEDQRFCEGLNQIQIDSSRLAVVRQTIAKRSRSFMDALMAELNEEALTSALSEKTVKVGLLVCAIENVPP
jgi:hypothetical protein